MTHPDLAAAILADSSMSVRECATAHGVSKDVVARIRKKFRDGPATVAASVAAVAATKKRADRWLDLAERVLEANMAFLEKAAKDNLVATKDTKVIHAICGSVKVLIDGLAQWKVTGDAGRTETGPANEGPNPPGTESGTNSNVVPIIRAG